MTPRLSTLLHLFEHTVESVVLCGSEIWGTVNILSSKIKKVDFKFENLLENFLCDKLHIKFLKYISKMGKKSCNTAVISEFGRYLLNIKDLVNTCKYFQRLLTTNSELLQCAYKESCTIASHDKVSLVSCVKFLLKQLGVSTKIAYQQNVSSLVKTKLINRFKENLAYNLAQCKELYQGKLRTYALFKNVFQKEKYLSVIKDTDIHKCFMSFRISSHKLEIERGWNKKHSVKDRLCKSCNSGAVEDEKHFIFNCKLYSCLRQTFCSDVKKSCKNFSSLSQDDQLFWLMTNESDTLFFRFQNIYLTVLISEVFKYLFKPERSNSL